MVLRTLHCYCFKLLQIMRNAAAPGFASFASCADRALPWWGACSPLLTEQFSAYLPGLGKPAGRRKVLRAVFCPIFCCSAAPQCSQGKWPQARWLDRLVGRSACLSVGWLVGARPSLSCSLSDQQFAAPLHRVQICREQ